MIDAGFCQRAKGSDGESTAAARNAAEFAKAGDAKPFAGLAADDTRLARVAGWRQSGFPASSPAAPRPLFHDLAASSTGLLTNVTAGGFRKDLSLQLERAVASIPKTALYTVNRENGINLPELGTYYDLYKKINRSATYNYTTSGKRESRHPHLVVAASPSVCATDDEFHLKQPAIINHQLVLSFKAPPVTVNGVAKTRLHVVADPVITMWNPLDIPVVVPAGSFITVKYWQVPYDIAVSVNGGAAARAPLAASPSGSSVGNNKDFNFLSIQIGSVGGPLVFKPGKVIKFSQSDDMAVMVAGKTGNSVTVGNAHTRHFSLNHHGVYVGPDRGELPAGLCYGGMYIDWDFGNRRLKAGEIRAENQSGTKPPAERLYADRLPAVFKPITAKGARPLGYSQLISTKSPFVMLAYDAKTGAGGDSGTRALARFNPRAHHVDFYDISQSERDILPYEFRVEPLGSWVNHLSEPQTPPRRVFGVWSVGRNVSLATVTLPEQGNSFVVQLVPAAGGGFKPVVIAARDKDFAPGDIYFYNHADKTVLGYVGTAKFILEPAQGKTLRPAGTSGEGPFYQIGLGVREKDGDRPLSTARWPVRKDIRMYVFFFINPRTQCLDFRAVDGFVKPGK